MTRLVAGLFIAIGLIVGGWFVGNGFAHSRNERFVTGKGLAEHDVKADIALWRIRFVETGDKLADVQAAVQHDEAAVTAFLGQHKLGKDDSACRNVQVTDRAAQMYGNQQYKTRFIVTGTIMVRTKNVDAVAVAAQDTGAQIAHDSDSKLGGIRRANQGVFQILPRDKAPMLQEDKQVDKTVRVVATLDYTLKD